MVYGQAGGFAACGAAQTCLQLLRDPAGKGLPKPSLGWEIRAIWLLQRLPEPLRTHRSGTETEFVPSTTVSNSLGNLG